MLNPFSIGYCDESCPMIKSRSSLWPMRFMPLLAMLVVGLTTTDSNALTHSAYSTATGSQYTYDVAKFSREAHPAKSMPADGYIFQGREWDAHRQDYYFRNRIYVPEWGSFTGPDMNLANGIEGEPNGVGNYVFANNNPLDVRDPLGLAGSEQTLLPETAETRFKEEYEGIRDPQAEANMGGSRVELRREYDRLASLLKKTKGDPDVPSYILARMRKAMDRADDALREELRERPDVEAQTREIEDAVQALQNARGELAWFRESGGQGQYPTEALKKSEFDVMYKELRDSTRPVTREMRWVALAGEGNLSKQETEFIGRHGGKGVRDVFGKELAHPPRRATAQGYDYGETIPKTMADHRGIQHRYLQERSTGTTISHAPKPRSGSALDLPPEGALP